MKNEPAFPANDCKHDNINCPRGLTIRDYFAAKALQGMCACGMEYPAEYTDRATESYRLADAMLKEKAKK